MHAWTSINTWFEIWSNSSSHNKVSFMYIKLCTTYCKARLTPYSRAVCPSRNRLDTHTTFQTSYPSVIKQFIHLSPIASLTGALPVLKAPPDTSQSKYSGFPNQTHSQSSGKHPQPNYYTLQVVSHHPSTRRTHSLPWPWLLCWEAACKEWERETGRSEICVQERICM